MLDRSEPAVKFRSVCVSVCVRGRDPTTYRTLGNIRELVVLAEVVMKHAYFYLGNSYYGMMKCLEVIYYVSQLIQMVLIKVGTEGVYQC